MNTLSSEPRKLSTAQHAIVTVFGLGLSPIFPGSVAALVGVMLHLAAYHIVPTDYLRFSLSLLLSLVLLLHYSVASAVKDAWGDIDSPKFVLDEIIGYLVVALICVKLPVTITASAGYLLFRVFDIIKFPGARYIDTTMKTATGVILDDIISACYASVSLFILVYLYQTWSDFSTFLRHSL